MNDQQPDCFIAVPEPSILRIYLRGGGVLVLDRVIDCAYRANATGRGLNYISLHQAPDARCRLIVGALDLQCVEAMVMEHKTSTTLLPAKDPA